MFSLRDAVTSSLATESLVTDHKKRISARFRFLVSFFSIHGWDPDSQDFVARDSVIAMFKTKKLFYRYLFCFYRTGANVIKLMTAISYEFS
jgi:hypothetical protein